MAAELTDRFGGLPDEVENLLQVVAIKALCREAGVEKLDAGPKGIVVSFFRNQPRNPAGLVQWIAAQKGLVKLRPDHKLALLREMELPQRVRVAKELLTALAKVAQQGRVPEKPNGARPARPAAKAPAKPRPAAFPAPRAPAPPQSRGGRR
jgi:transcription-repair coupling factor (superfamily II helicase)